MNLQVLEKIRKAIEKIGTQKQVAEIFGVTQPTISKWKKRGVPVSKTVLFCEVLKATEGVSALNPSDIHPQIFLKQVNTR